MCLLEGWINPLDWSARDGRNAGELLTKGVLIKQNAGKPTGNYLKANGT
jgi:hypothetical protein